MRLTRSRTIWEEGHEPGREVAALGVALVLTIAVLDLLIFEELGPLFDLGFVLLCVVLALAVRPTDFFMVGVLPPQLLLLVLLLLGLAEPGAIARPEDGMLQAVVTGLARHSVALIVGYLLCLGCLLIRRRFVGNVPIIN